MKVKEIKILQILFLKISVMIVILKVATVDGRQKGSHFPPLQSKSFKFLILVPQCDIQLLHHFLVQQSETEASVYFNIFTYFHVTEIYKLFISLLLFIFTQKLNSLTLGIFDVLHINYTLYE